MKTCPDCGCRTNNGICSNCQEELYILEHQSRDMSYPISEDFLQKAGEQRRYLNKREVLK